MTEPTSDEDWAAGLQAYARAATPTVPVDVPGAVRRGRRRRAVRRVATGGGALAVACGVVVVAVAAVPSLLGGLGPADDSAADSSSVADDAGGTTSESARVLTVEDLATGLADGSVEVRAEDRADGGTTEPLTVVQDGVPDLTTYLATIESALTAGPAAPAPGPAASPHRVAADAWPAAMTDCLGSAGDWVVTATETGWEAEVEPDVATAFLADVGTCAAGLPTS